MGHFMLWRRAVTMRLWGPLKLILGKTDIEFGVVAGLQEYCKGILGSQSNTISKPFYSCGPSYRVSYNKWSVVRFEVPWSRGLVLTTHHFEVGLTQNLIYNETLTLPCHVGLHAGVSSISTPWFLRPSSCSVKWCATALAFSTNEIF